MNKIYIFMILCAMFFTGCTKTEISEANAKSIAFDHTQVTQDDITSIQVEKDNDDGMELYTIEFHTNTASYEYEIKRTDGTIIKSEVKTKSDNTTSTTQITKEKAKEIALKDANIEEKDTIYMHVTQDSDDNIQVYEVEFYADGKEYDYTISQSDGTIVSKDYDIENYTPNKTTTSTISLEEAKQLVSKRIDGVNIEDIQMHLDYDDGIQVYEGKVYHKNKKYEFKIHASTKEFLEWSEER